MAFFLAVDAGGTKADLLLADEHTVLGRVRTGTIKRMRADVATVTHNLDAGLSELAHLTGISMSSIARTCIGTAGETVPLVTDWLSEAFSARVAGELLLLGDVEIALDAAFHGGPGVLVLAGTGSNVAGRTPAGTLTGAGGYGPALADQGSGHRIGHEALRAIFLAIDEEQPTLLLQSVLAYWSLTTVDQLIEHANQIPSPDFSRLAQVVLTCAQQSDAVALAILRQEGESLAHLASLVTHRLQRAAKLADWVPPVAFAGSILENVAPVRDALVAKLRREFPDIETLSGVVDPIFGALWHARQRA